MLNINNTFANVFKATPVIAFRKNTSLRQIIGTNTINHNQEPLKVKQSVTKGECIPCNISPCLSYQQIIATTTFESIQTKEKFNIYNIYSKISCKSKYVIYLFFLLWQIFFFFYIYILRLFKQKVYSHQVFIYLNVPGIPVKKPLQNNQIVGEQLNVWI